LLRCRINWIISAASKTFLCQHEKESISDREEEESGKQVLLEISLGGSENKSKHMLWDLSKGKSGRRMCFQMSLQVRNIVQNL
jgi:hypothetical protein